MNSEHMQMMLIVFLAITSLFLLWRVIDGGVTTTHLTAEITSLKRDAEDLILVCNSLVDSGDINAVLAGFDEHGIPYEVNEEVVIFPGGALEVDGNTILRVTKEI